MEAKKQVGIWIRVSTEDQARGESPEHHELRARHYATAKEWNVVTVYHLEAVSGKAVMAHPEAKRMLKDIKDGTISGIIFSKLARLARNTKELLEFADIFNKHNADLISLGESIDTSTPAGRLFYTVIAATTQFEREEIASRVAASVPIRAKLGKTLGGQATFGYRWDKAANQLVVEPKEATVRVLMYDIFLRTKRKMSTADELNALGHRTRNRSKFTGNTIDRLLRDPTAKGQRIANYTKSNGPGKNWVIKPKEEWVVTPCPAIITEEIWSECNRILDGQHKKRKGRLIAHLFAGYVYCTCGKKMYVYHSNLVYTCKQCKIRIPAADLEEIYHGELKSFLLTDTDTETYLEKSTVVIAEKQKRLESITDETVTLKKKMDNLVKMRLDQELTKEEFIAYHKPYAEQLSRLHEKMPELEGEIDFLKIQSQSSEAVFTDARNLYERWQDMKPEERRSIVEDITNSITIGKEEISIKLAHVPTSFKNAENTDTTSGVHARHQ